jgi:hypothetical protein
MKWYKDVFGLVVLAGPVEIGNNRASTDPHLAATVTKIFGPRLGRFLICHLKSASGVGIELFEFLEPASERRESNFEYWKTGFFHIAFTDPRLDELVKKISFSGGRQRTDILEIVPGSGIKICFCEDPFGNIIEIYSHSYEQFWASNPSQ